MLTKLLISFFSLSAIFACNSEKNIKVMSTSLNSAMDPSTMGKIDNVETATFGTGCFWCTEAIFEQLDGVVKVTSGYMGGKVKNPTYKEVCTGETGHAECVQVVFEPSKIAYDDLVKVFFEVHDPTSLNKQGADEGTQYRSAIFYHTPQQKEKAEYYKREVNASGAYDKTIVTEVTPASEFYVAEDYHQEYYQNNKNTNPYCSIVIRPKLEKFQKVFAGKLKKA